MKIVFMGTAEFAVPSLYKLAETENITAVITVIDKPKGRGLHSEETPVKRAAKELGIAVIPLEKIRNEEIVNKVKELAPDLIAVVDFGMMIPDAILALPRFGVICLHPSLLPKYRGASPIEYALLNGDKVTGNTIFYVVKEVDSGDIIIQKEHKILDDDTNGSLREKLSVEGAELFIEAVKLIKEGGARAKPQNHAQATFTKKLEKENINWDDEASRVHNKIRAFTPKPGIFTAYKDKKLKIIKSKVIDTNAGSGAVGQAFRLAETRKSPVPGEIIDIVKDEGFAVFCGSTVGNRHACSLLILEVHPESKNKMSAWSFANGYRIAVGDRLC